MDNTEIRLAQQTGANNALNSELEHEDIDTVEDANFASTPIVSSDTPGGKKRGRGPHLDHDQWDEMFLRLQSYKEAHGHLLVAKRDRQDPKLGRWVGNQRNEFRKNLKEAMPGKTTLELDNIIYATPDPTKLVKPSKRLSSNRLRRLQEIGFVWHVNSKRRSRSVGSISNTPATTINICADVSQDKKKFSDGITAAEEKAPITSRIAVDNKREDTEWDEVFKRLVHYKEKNGDCLVPKKFNDDLQLATWVETQRVLYIMEYDDEVDTSEGRYAQGGSNGWKRDGAGASGKSASNEQPSSNQIPSKLKPTKILTKERKSKLESLGFVWSLPTKVDEQWEEMFKQLLEYKAEHGDCLVPYRSKEYPDLGQWVYDRRYEYGKLVRTGVNISTGRINPQPGTAASKSDLSGTIKRLKRLEAVGFVWNMKHHYASKWEDMFAQLQEYKATHGNCVVPLKYKENMKLGKFVADCRLEYNKLIKAGMNTSIWQMNGEGTSSTKSTSTKLSRTIERMKRLEALGFEWYGGNKLKRLHKDWDKMFQKLINFKYKYGHCRVPKSYSGDPLLVTWVHGLRSQNHDMKTKGETKTQKSMHSDGTMQENPDQRVSDDSICLSEDQKRQLDEIGFVWEVIPRKERAKISREENHARKDSKWFEMYERLKDYREKYGNAIVPTLYKEDRKLAKWVDKQRVQYKKNTTESLSTTNKKLPIKSSNTLRIERARIKCLESLGFVWDSHEAWQVHYSELVRYKEENGNCDVPARYDKNIPLSCWVKDQRQQYKVLKEEETGMEKGRVCMEEEKVCMKIKEADFNQDNDGTKKTEIGTCPDLNQEENGTKKNEIESYQKDNDMKERKTESKGENDSKTKDIDLKKKDEEIYPNLPKKQKRKSSNDLSLTAERIELLNALGFKWKFRTFDCPISQWNKRFEELQKYNDEHKNCLVPARYPPNPELGIWVGTQRYQYRLYWQEKKEGTITAKRSAMTEERIKRLENLGFVWSLVRTTEGLDQWNARFEELRKFHEEHKNCLVPARYPPNPELGVWVGTQRSQYRLYMEEKQQRSLGSRRSSMTEERINRLEEIGFVWSLVRTNDGLDQWNARFEELRKFREERNNCLVPARYPPNPVLGVWVGTQRTQYRLYMKAKKEGNHGKKKSSMTEERIKRLNELGFVWSASSCADYLWKKRMNELEEFKELHGHCKVPVKYPPNPRLGTWAASMRKQMKKLSEGKISTLDDGMIAHLDSIGFCWSLEDSSNSVHPFSLQDDENYYDDEGINDAVENEERGENEIEGEEEVYEEEEEEGQGIGEDLEEQDDIQSLMYVRNSQMYMKKLDSSANHASMASHQVTGLNASEDINTLPPINPQFVGYGASNFSVASRSMRIGNDARFVTNSGPNYPMPSRPSVIDARMYGASNSMPGQNMHTSPGLMTLAAMGGVESIGLRYNVTKPNLINGQVPINVTEASGVIPKAAHDLSMEQQMSDFDPLPLKK